MTQHDSPPQTEPLRIGVFFDGGFWSALVTYWKYGHPTPRRLTFEGIQDAIRWYAHKVFDRPIKEIKIDQSHYVHHLNTPLPGKVAYILDGLCIQRHTLPPHPFEKYAPGVETALALKCWDEDAAALDMLVLVVNFSKYRPLVDILVEGGSRVMVPTINVENIDSRTGQRRVLKTSEHLTVAATDTPSWESLINATLEEGYPFATTLTPWKTTSTHGEVARSHQERATPEQAHLVPAETAPSAQRIGWSDRNSMRVSAAMDYRKLFRSVRHRPTLYGLDSTYGAGVAFILGCDTGTSGVLLSGFREWLITRLGAGNDLSWQDLALQIINTTTGERDDEPANNSIDTRRFHQLFQLLDEFLGQRSKRDGMVRIYDRYIEWLKGQPWFRPELLH